MGRRHHLCWRLEEKEYLSVFARLPSTVSLQLANHLIHIFNNLSMYFFYFMCLTPGDGTMLLVASKVCDKSKPVLGVNTDPER